jgi:hypothetical protein
VAAEEEAFQLLEPAKLIVARRARLNSCEALARKRRYGEIIRYLRAGLVVGGDAESARILAWWLATCPEPRRRNGAEAVRRAEALVRVVPTDDPNHSTYRPPPMRKRTTLKDRRRQYGKRRNRPAYTAGPPQPRRSKRGCRAFHQRRAYNNGSRHEVAVAARAHEWSPRIAALQPGGYVPRCRMSSRYFSSA